MAHHERSTHSLRAVPGLHIAVCHDDAGLRGVGRLDEEGVLAPALGGEVPVPRHGGADRAGPANVLTGAGDTLAELLRQEPVEGPALCRLQEVCLSGTWDRWLDDARRELGPPLSTALGWRSMTQLLAGRTPDRHTSDFVHLPLRLGTRRVPSVRLVQRAHDHGLRVVVWGVENARETHRLLDDGVDGVITNHTDLIREALLARGSWHVPTPARAC